MRQTIVVAVLRTAAIVGTYAMGRTSEKRSYYRRNIVPMKNEENSNFEHGQNMKRHD